MSEARSLGGRAPRGSRPPEQLQSVANAARLLREFGTVHTGVGVTELARRLGLGKSTVHRLLRTLVAEGLVEQDLDRGLYRLGVAVHELGNAVIIRRQLHAAGTVVLEELRSRTRESVQISVLDGREVVYVDRLDSTHSLRVFRTFGYRNWAHATSTGKVLLAGLPEHRLAGILDGWDLPSLTDRTIATVDALVAELERTRSRGFATNLEESELGVASVAAPIHDSSGAVIAALSLVAPTVRLNRSTLRPITQQVIAAADETSRRLGRGPARSAKH